LGSHALTPGPLRGATIGFADIIIPHAGEGEPTGPQPTKRRSIVVAQVTFAEHRVGG